MVQVAIRLTCNKEGEGDTITEKEGSAFNYSKLIIIWWCVLIWQSNFKKTEVIIGFRPLL